MKKIIVLKSFVDRDDESVSYAPGQLLEFEDGRVDNLVKRGLASLDDSEQKAADAEAKRKEAESKKAADAEAKKKEAESKTDQK